MIIGALSLISDAFSSNDTMNAMPNCRNGIATFHNSKAAIEKGEKTVMKFLNDSCL